MIFNDQFISSSNGGFVTATFDINFAPQNILAFTTLGGLSNFNGSWPFLQFAGGSGFCGFTMFTKVDPDTGVPTQVDLTAGTFFGCQPIFTGANVDTVTFLIGASDSGGATFVQAYAQVFSMAADGTLS